MMIMMQSGNGCIRDREYILIIEVSMEQYVIKGGIFPDRRQQARRGRAGSGGAEIQITLFRIFI